jgi:hypothetical protein
MLHETAVFMHHPSTWARRAAPDHRLRGVILVGPYTYEITFTGQASPTVRAEFDDCTVIVGPNTTTLRAQLPDQGALWDSCSGSSASNSKWWTCTS